jgi:hypothetical protein
MISGRLLIIDEKSHKHEREYDYESSIPDSGIYVAVLWPSEVRRILFLVAI